MKIKAVDVNEVVEQTKLMRIVTLPLLYFSFCLVKLFNSIYYIKGNMCYSSTRARFGVLQCAFRKIIANPNLFKITR